jgi:hypothetical protein
MPKHMTYKAYRKAKGGKEMSYEDYKKNATEGGMSYMNGKDYSKAEDDENGNENAAADKDDDQDDEEEGAEKSETLDATDLMKAIGDYETLEESLTMSGGSRESMLTDKMREGTITKSEQQELGRIWSGNANGDEQLNKSLTERIEAADPDAAGLIDASDFLKSLVDETNGALSGISATVERDGRTTRNLLAGQGQLLKATAQVLSNQNALIKSQQVVINEMGRRLGVLEGEPVIRKSQGADPRDVAPRHPGQGGGRGGDPNALTKSQVQQGLRGLMLKAAAANDDSAIDNLSHATALYESNGRIHPNIAGAIRMELGI